MKVVIGLFLILAGVLFFWGCSSYNSTSYTTTTAAGTTTTTVAVGTGSVSIADYSFTPQAITAATETTITWTNNSSIYAHRVQSTSGPVSFDSGSIAPGATYSLKFSTAGTYVYEDPTYAATYGMTGEVVVQ